MPRRSRMLATGVALVLATLATATPASASASAWASVTPAAASSSASSGVGGNAPAAVAVAPAPPLSDSMAAIGDSITQAVDVCCFYGDWPSHSWSTGSASLDGIASHYERIRAQNPA